ncbi:prolipoprotein diacylglyceryl transferase [Companilactobacillus sp.]|jgi:phosphatidylglycerol:prolipoprotein diacylglycerol transferase|uniref:prolipoprotein diacylglyceryl transferase n=1 Tax=Companilactobacillus sp. TaxID=2767905 RepID=UPI0025BE0D45|nr:prolipoprotein diacylglyceryl transferase [Companilactobacillus sp.]MCH4008790.1 prolipoprotein diacylglyceryl transferase [Companilactobacillus sp.]MCH4051031.1 prolipoprotein diacylglyceryl transferase [Companilactobacillus sp.]MCH4076733.1 prolipoprotein diacylglyceryl transferase [Companilactobacillus sp.]MCH4125308.1 prolipoprotein diacylglyceryl transferase [Companilactobacillus sp.]MCH4131848.1 prolipoprotein diacylglyceryl transferase [Companilactobacillus sp.]
MTLLALNPIAFNLGGLEIHWYGIIIALGALVGVIMAMREATRRGINSDNILDLVLIGVPVGLICARIYYVIFELPFYIANPGEIIKIWHGGIAIYGGLIGGFIVLLVLCLRRKISVWLMLDIAAPSVLLGQIVGRWGNFMNQEAFGAKTSLDFLQSLHLPHFVIEQMFINGAYRQPTFLYESFFNLIGLILILVLRHRKHFYKVGEVFLSYLVWYPIVRFFVEGMRTDSLYILPGVRVSQMLSLILLIFAIGAWIYRRKKMDLPWYTDLTRQNNGKNK